MRTNSDIKNLACDNGYGYVNTTSEASGYPKNIKTAIVGFRNWEEAKGFADKHGLHLVQLEGKRNGPDLWTGQENFLYEAPEVTCEDFGGIAQYYNFTPKEEIVNDMKSIMQDLDDLDDIYDLARMYRGIWNTIQDIGDNQAVFVIDDFVDDIFDRYPMKWEHDNLCHLVGAIE